MYNKAFNLYFLVSSWWAYYSKWFRVNKILPYPALPYCIFVICGVCAVMLDNAGLVHLQRLIIQWNKIIIFLKRSRFSSYILNPLKNISSFQCQICQKNLIFLKRRKKLHLFLFCICIRNLHSVTKCWFLLRSTFMGFDRVMTSYMVVHK